jgi:hypothetical protein
MKIKNILILMTAIFASTQTWGYVNSNGKEITAQEYLNLLEQKNARLSKESDSLRENANGLSAYSQELIEQEKNNNERTSAIIKRYNEMSEAIDDLENNRDEEYLRLSPFFDVDLEEQKELLEDPQTAREILKQMKEARDKLANYLARFADNTASEIIQELKANHQNVLNQLKDEIQSEDNEMNQID